MRTLTAAATAVLLAGLSVGSATASSAEEPSCPLYQPFAGNGTEVVRMPVLTTTDVDLQVSMSVPMGSPCPGITVQLQKTDGTHKKTVALDHYTAGGMPPTFLQYGYLRIPVYDGAGTWEFTRLSRGTEVLELDNQFKILRGSYTSLDEPTTVVSPRPTVVTGWVWNYTRVGGLTPSAGRTVRIGDDRGAALAITRTDSRGRFAASFPVWRRLSFAAKAEPLSWTAASTSTWVTTSVRLGLYQLQAPATVRLGGWWWVTGQAFPGRLSTSVDYWNGTTWAWTGSSGYTDSRAWFKRYWKPTRTGTFRLRLTVTANPAIGLLGSPAVRYFTVTVVR